MDRLRIACSVAAAIAIASALPGCPESRSSGGALACTYRATPDGGTSAFDDTSCAVYGGTVVPTSCFRPFVRVPSCPTEGRVGQCVVVQETSGGRSETTLHSYAPLTVEDARSSCASVMGTFTPL